MIKTAPLSIGHWVLWFEGPKSFTGEDSVELHLHGSVAILESIARRLVELGLRQALPGEFTRRAVEGGKMDLTEAEGLADLIDARSEGQRIQALQNLSLIHISEPTRPY